MRWLIATALRLRLAVVAVTLAFAVFAWRAVGDSPFDVFPEFAPPQVEIQTEAPGLSTEEVERLVTVPIENALAGTSFLKSIRSKSVLGLSSVVLIFQDGTDLLKARQSVQERMPRVTALLPALARVPVLLSPLSSTSRAMKIGVSSKTLSQVELTTLAKWTIRPRLMAVPGVANVAIWGQRDKQLQVLVDPARLHANRVGLDQVVQAARDAVSMEAGGYIDTPNQRIAVAHRPHVTTPATLGAATVLVRNGSPLRLRDVGTVVEGTPPAIGDAVINDGPGLLLIVEKLPWGNTLSVTKGVEAALEQLKPGLVGVDVDPTIFRPATFIEMSLDNLNRALLIGCVLVMLVLMVFLRDWRSAAVSIVALPLSLLAAAVVLRYRGGTMDTMVLAGLVIALGEVVDDAIIDVENIVRRLRLNARRSVPQPPLAVVLAASLEVRSSVVYASLIVALVFLPVFFLDGLAGSFFRPLAQAYVLAIMASLAVALVVTPVLSLLLLPASAARQHTDPRSVTRLKDWYRATLAGVIARPRWAFTTLGVGIALSMAVVPFLGEEFLPDFREYDFLMHWVEKPGTSLEAMTRITERASAEMRAVPGVRNFGAHIGRAEVADEVVGPNFTELWISLDPTVNYDATRDTLQRIVDGYPGLYRDLLTYLRERIKEVLTGASATIVVRLYGPDLAVLRAKGNELAATLKDVPGVSDLKVQPLTMVPQLEVTFRPEAAERHGLSAGGVRRAISTMVKGTKVGEYHEDQRVFDVTVWGQPKLRSDPLALQSLTLDTPTGGLVPLGAVADVVMMPTPNEVTRENGSRRLDVTTNVRGRDLGSVARDVERAVRGMSFPSGYHPEVLGEYAARQAARARLIALSLLSFVAVFLILHADFGSVRTATLVFATLPFALVGGVAAVLLGGGVLSLGSLVGFVTVLGIAARNGIMLVSHFRHLESEEGMTFGPELVLRGAEERLVPILMTAAATALALVPLVASGVKPGQEIEHPMSLVILGGLVTSTALNLVVVPALYLRFGKPSA